MLAPESRPARFSGCVTALVWLGRLSQPARRAAALLVPCREDQTPSNSPLDFPFVPGLQSGKTKLAQPEGCPSRLAKLMQRCWAPSPKDRPSFSELATALGDSPADSKA